MTPEEFSTILKDSDLPLRLKKEFKDKKPDLDFTDKEFMVVSDKSATHGLMIFNPAIAPTAIPYELNKIAGNKTGRLKPITCDMCVTWLPGSKAATITFQHKGLKTTTHTFYCCGNLACSQNVREQTAEALESRTQLREDISEEGRIDRLRDRLSSILLTIGYK